jgi:hypothetical protein
MPLASHPMASSLRASDTGKVVSAREAVRLIQDGDTVATGGFVGIGFAENIAVALEELFLEGESEDVRRSWPPLQPDPGVCGRTGRRQGARTQPPRPRWPGQPRHRWSLGTRSKAPATGGSESHSGLQPAAGGDHPPLPRYRRGQARHHYPRRPGHLRGPALWRRQAERHDHRRYRAGDGNRWRGVPVLQGLPDQHRHHPRHHRRPGWQRDDGKGGTDARGTGHRHGGPELGRHCHRPGRTYRRARHAQPAAGQDSGHPRRLRGGRREARVPHADLRRTIQPGVRWRDPGAAVGDSRDADERAQDHRAAGGARTQGQRHRQPRHRHAGGRRQHRRRGEDLRPDDDDRRARRDRRHPGRRPQFRRIHQCRGDHRPAEPVRLLRRWRPRYRVSRPRAGGSPGQPQRLEVRTAPGRSRRLHQHLAEREEGRLRRHLHRRQPGDRARRRQIAHPRGRQGTQVRRRSRASDLQRPAGAEKRHDASFT